MADSVRFMGIRQRLGQSDSPIGHGTGKRESTDLDSREGIRQAREIQKQISQYVIEKNQQSPKAFHPGTVNGELYENSESEQICHTLDPGKSQGN